jgi:ribosome biogenesis GTPase / thiamine phosphate phosphatase
MIPRGGYNGAVAEGMVVEYHREYCTVEMEDGREVIAKPRARLELDSREFARQIALGDTVEVSEPEPGSFAIERIGLRETWLLRHNALSYRVKPQCVVVNADQLAVVTAPEPGISLNLVDRYFIAAIQGGLSPLLIVNKADLRPDVQSSPDLLCYRGIGYRVVFTSARTGQGLDGLLPMLADKLTAFCGHSGVGKSSILTKLTGREITTGALSAAHGKGRQTTTTARIYHLPGGGRVLDTPGIREFGLAHLDWTDVHEYFSDIASHATGCGFRDCLHKSEPGCKVREAAAAGLISPGRLESYIKLREESDRPEWKQKAGLP